MKVMVLSPYLPHPRVGHGGGTAVRDLIKWLARDHEVLLVSLLRPGEECCVDDVRTLDPSGRLQVATIDFTDNMARGRRRVVLARSRVMAAGRAALTGYPYYVAKYYSRAISRRIQALARSFQPDAIQIEYLQMALYCRDLRTMRQAAGSPAPRLILNSHELGSLPRERRARRADNPVVRQVARKEAAAWRRLQVEASGWADATLCVTPGDRALYEAMGGTHLKTVPLGMDLERIEADWNPVAPDRFLFVGSFGHRPNVLAARFLVDEVWPQVRAAHPQAQLILAGRGSDRWLAQRRPRKGPSTEGIEAVGFVDDLTGLFRESRLFLAPLAEGGGIKIKILEAMARGIPVVTTPIGAEGIFEPKDDVAIMADCDESFAAAVLAALNDPKGCAERARRARELMEEKFSWEAITRLLARLYANPQAD